jgi:hypothetical protein
MLLEPISIALLSLRLLAGEKASLSFGGAGLLGVAENLLAAEEGLANRLCEDGVCLVELGRERMRLCGGEFGGVSESARLYASPASSRERLS